MAHYHMKYAFRLRDKTNGAPRHEIHLNSFAVLVRFYPSEPLDAINWLLENGVRARISRQVPHGYHDLMSIEFETQADQVHFILNFGGSLQIWASPESILEMLREGFQHSYTVEAAAV